MAQSVKRTEAVGAMDHEPQRDKIRTSYFGNVKTRLGSKLPAGVSHSSNFTRRPWETQPQARLEPPACDPRQRQVLAGRPLNHIPHIRNPKLRQYYLQGTSWEANSAPVKQEQMGRLSDDGSSSGDILADTVFSVSSQFSCKSASLDKRGPMWQYPLQPTCSPASLVPREQLVVPKGRNGGSRGAAPPGPGTVPDPGLKGEPGSEPEPDLSDTLPAQDQSPSPEAEYDKLLDVEAIPMPDGQLCLLALPPECCPGTGPTSTPYLKLFCRYITDGKGVVSGILLVTSNKIFFDPCKTHPLVKEHGCEEYLLSLSLDNLASVTFLSDISHVHFSHSQRRRKGRRTFQKLKNAKSQAGGFPDHKGETIRSLLFAGPADWPGLGLGLTKEASGDGEEEGRDMAEAELELDSPPPGMAEASVGALGAAVLNSAATFCCGGPEVPSELKKEEPNGAPTLSVKSQTSGCRGSSPGRPAALRFIRLRVQLSADRKKSLRGLQLGLSKPSPRRDAWLALSQESSDELRAYLRHCRPGLCILEDGETEREADEDEEEFVVIEDKHEEEEEEAEEEEGEEMSQRHRCSGDDWEMVLMEESKDKPAPVIDKNPEGLNHILESSHIFEASHITELSKELPPRTVGHTWQLLFSLSRHGASLKSLYRKLSAIDSPVLMAIKDVREEIFGAFLSHPLRPSEVFYGTGETFLFMLHPRFKCFRWTGENSFFIKGDIDSFAIGGGSGHFGLWVDENLYMGRSSPCYTFNNCCLSETDDFRIMEMEVWTFT